MICKHCGQQMPDGTLFCTACGQPLNSKRADDASQTQQGQSPQIKQGAVQASQVLRGSLSSQQGQQGQNAQMQQGQNVQTQQKQNAQVQQGQNVQAQQRRNAQVQQGQNAQIQQGQNVQAPQGQQQPQYIQPQQVYIPAPQPGSPGVTFPPVGAKKQKGPSPWIFVLMGVVVAALIALIVFAAVMGWRAMIDPEPQDEGTVGTTQIHTAPSKPEDPTVPTDPSASEDPSDASEPTSDTQETPTQPTLPSVRPTYDDRYTLTQVGVISDPDRKMRFANDALQQSVVNDVKMFTYLGQEFLPKIAGVQHLGNGVYLAQDTSGDVNSSAVVTLDGTTLIPFEACTARWAAKGEYVSRRYLIVTYATEETQDKDECFVYITDDAFSMGPSEGDTMYKGYSLVYDVHQARFVPDVTITNPYMYAAVPCGDHFLITDEASVTTLYDADGKALLQTDRNVSVGDHTFVVATSSGRNVYDEDGTLLFKSDVPVYLIDGNSDHLYRYAGTDHRCQIIDRNGNVVMAQTFDYIRGERDGLFHVDNDGFDGLIWADGTVVVPCDRFDSFYEVGMGYYYAFEDDGNGDTVYSLIGREGVIAEGLYDSPSDLVCVEDGKAFVIADGAHTLMLEDPYHMVLASALIRVRSDVMGHYGVYDLFTGEQLLGCEYKAIEEAAGYLYAYKDGAWTVYKIEGPEA